MKYLLSIAGIVILIWAFIHLSLNGIHIQTSQGEHTGYVTAVEQTGLFFKTYTAYIKTDTQSSQEDAYCVTDPAIYSQLQTLSEQKAHVTVGYIAWLGAGARYCSHESAGIITAVKTEN